MFSYLLLHPCRLWGLIYIFRYVHAGSPTVKNLTFDAQSRTLTCTSTGGPATTVTWRRDGLVITCNDTHQQTKRIVHNVTSTYQTVLTIHLSVGWSDIVGTYSCTVKNDRGESSETTIVPGEAWTLLFIVHAWLYIRRGTYMCCRSFVAWFIYQNWAQRTIFIHGWDIILLIPDPLRHSS